MSHYEDKNKTLEKTLKEMIELLPSSYNKEVDDTNYYKLLRALSHELSDAKLDIQKIKDNTYLETVSSELMYNNFGVLVKLRKDPKWSDEKYRHLIKGVTQSLFKGPTKKSLIDSFKLFTNFKVNIHELYKDYQNIDPTIYEGFNPMFTFILEIEKPIDEYVDQQALDRDTNYVINIIKPAHTLTINIVTLVGEENYRKFYRIDKVLGKEIQDTFDNKILARINDKIQQRFFDEARDYSIDNNVDFETATNMLRYQSNDINQVQYDQAVREISERLMQAHLASSSQCTPVRSRPIEFFIEQAKEFLRNTKFNNDPSRITLDLKYYKELRDEVFNNVNVELTKEKIYRKVVVKQEELIEEWENIGNSRFDKSDSEWYFEGLNALKEQYLREYIIQELGGQTKLWELCSTEVEGYRLILEQNLETTAPYCGMDQMESEASLVHTEGIFGWRHMDYDFQLKTSLDPNDSRIGGARLIGPRYVLNDTFTADIYTKYEDHLIPKFMNDNELQNYKEEEHFAFYKTEYETAPIPCDANTQMHIETSEDPFDTPDEEKHFYYQQNFHEFTNFLQSFPSFILNDSLLNDGAVYFPHEPDHIEEMHVEWDYTYAIKSIESTNEIIFGEQIENMPLPTIERSWEAEQTYEEVTNFLKRYPSFVLNDSVINDHPIYSDFEPDYLEEIQVEWDYTYSIKNIESEMVIDFGEQLEQLRAAVEAYEYLWEWNLSEYPNKPIESLDTDVIGVGFEENAPQSSEEFESPELELEEEYEFLNFDYFELNDSPINDSYVNGLQADECTVKMYRVQNGVETIIKVEAI